MRVFVLLVLLASLLTPPRVMQWADLPEAVQRALPPLGVTGASFDAWRTRVQAANAARLRDGDFDHLIHYALQSTRFTRLPPIEPALSAKAFVESWPPEERARLLADPAFPVPADRVPADARARLAALSRALARHSTDARMLHFQDVARNASDKALLREYERAMRFLYEKEFVAGRSAASAAAVAELYRSRGHSSDTAIEAGYGVYVALATLRQLEPARRIGQVLIVGPGLDLAPRTGLHDDAPPQSYQPFAVADALLGLKLSDRRALRIDAVDLNPHVVRSIERSARGPAMRLLLTSEIAEDARTTLTDEYRDYVAGIGRSLGLEQPRSSAGGRTSKAIDVSRDVQAMLHARPLDVVAQRISDAPSYDLVIVTNVFPYLGDAELLVALANIAAALRPGGHLIHNEPRPLLLSGTAAMGLPAIQSRTLLLATVQGGQNLYDTIWLHQRAGVATPPR